jgi:cytochrome b subunit of formate dehydrogenase
MVMSPMLGFGIAFAFAIAMMYFLRQKRASKVTRYLVNYNGFICIFSLIRGANDGQKTWVS